jgi:hypothetical protein
MANDRAKCKLVGFRATAVFISMTNAAVDSKEAWINRAGIVTIFLTAGPPRIPPFIFERKIFSSSTIRSLNLDPTDVSDFRCSLVGGQRIILNLRVGSDGRQDL